MKITDCWNSDDSREFIEAIGLLDALQPKTPGCKTCSALQQLAPDRHCIYVNEDGKYHMHLLEDCTADEAHQFLKDQMPVILDTRIAFTGEKADKAGMN